MSKPCCGNYPLVLKDKSWVCSECGSLADAQMYLFSGPLYFSSPSFEEKTCDCGAVKLHGPNPPGHYPMCSINKK